jgi:RHS repeat-associated protein
MDDVVLVPFDANASLVTMGNPSTQIARATEVRDDDGARTATLIIPSGESATVITPDGTSTVASSLHVRATEYTVGSTGPNAMPASLPTMSGYTYCVELSADEATGASVQFSRPLSLYFENFLAFPVGTPVPVGYYDRTRQHWISERNGFVIRIVAITAGLATIDTNGDGLAESASALASLGFDDGERRALASLYPAGQTLWRIRTNHFTPFDGNLPLRSPADAVGPKGKAKRQIGSTSAKCKTFGWSIVDCANQSLGESIPITGTPYALEYNSARANRTQYSTDIELSGSTVPASLKAIELNVTIAGQEHKLTFPPAANQRYRFTWDGTDEFGRAITGARKAVITVTYAYPMLYAPTTDNPGWDVPGDYVLDVIRRTGDFRVSESSELYLGHFDTGNAGFGGWSFSGQHLYDGIGRTIYEAGGDERSSDPQQTHETELRTLAIGGGSALSPLTVAAAPDGSLYFSDRYQLKKKSPDGTVTTIAGTTSGGFTDDGFTTEGNPLNPWQITMGPDGTLYVIDDSRVRAIVNGRWVTVAGTSQYEPGGAYTLPEGVPATSRPITPWSLTTGRDGALYIGGRTRIYKVGPDDIIHTVGGGGPNSTFIDGAQASGVSLGTVYGIAVAQDGTIYYANGSMVGRVTTDGLIFHVAGPFIQPRSVAVAADGTVLVADASAFKVFEVSTDGTARGLVGTGAFSRNDEVAIGIGRSVAALPWEVKIAPDGSVWIVDFGFNTIRHAGALFPPTRTASATVVPSEGGGVAYVFEGGRHTRSVDTLNGVTIETLAYDAAGNLISVTNVDGLATQIERNAAGDPIAIVAANGQQTTLAIAGGQLRSITVPGGASYSFDYNSSGLLSKLVDRRGGLHQFTYDDDGLLIRDDDPVGGFIALGRSGEGSSFNVSRTSAEGRTQSFANASDGSGSELHTSVGSTGLTMSSGSYGATDSMSSSAVQITTLKRADSRFGMLSPLASASVTLGTKTLQLSRSRTTTLSSPDNFLVPSSVTATTTVNSRTWTSTYDGGTRVLTSRSPLGRQSSTTFDAKGRPVIIHAPLVTDVTNVYDGRGRINTVTRGARVTTFTYDGFDRVQSVTDPMQRTVSFAYDAANHVTTKTLTDGRTIGFSYDDAGNVTSITPPSRAPHLFTFTGIDFLEAYTPPGIGPTTYRYNRDRQVTLIKRPDGTDITNSYDTAGRLSTVTTPFGNFNVTYSSSTGLIESMTAPSNVLTRYTYDGALPVTITSSGMVNGSISITYDNDLNVTSKSVNGTAPIGYAYDGDGLLTSVGMETISRDPLNGRVTETTAGLIRDTRTYDELGQVSDYTALLSASPLFTQHYTHDAAGRITAIDETTGSTTVTRAFSYDTAGRLATVTQNGAPAATYTYDGNSNRLTRVTGAGTESGTYDDQDRVTSYGGFTFTYTPNGEIASKTSAFGTTGYRYDSFGNLIGVTLPGGRVIEYILDARSRRVARKLDGAVTQKFLYSDGLRPIAQLAPDDSVVYRFLYAERANVPSLIVGTSATYRVIADHGGSSRGIVDIATGSPVQYLAYDEFGNITTDTNPAFQPFAFAGGLYDPDTHLVHFGAREYDPSLGRFLTRDPLGLGGGQTNVYDYAANDPVNFGDPSGLMPLDKDGATAQDFYADILADPSAGAWAKIGASIGGAFAALWTPCTSNTTFTVLVTAATIGAGAPLAAEEATADALSEGISGTFENRVYTSRVLSEDMTVFRAEGRPFGNFYGTTAPDSAANAERLYNISQYGNDIQEVSTYNIPTGTTVYEGNVAGGAGRQIYLSDPVGAGVEMVGNPMPLPQFGH